MTNLSIIAAIISAAGVSQAQAPAGGRPTPPPEPAVKPIITAPRDKDTDGDKLDDKLKSRAASAKSVQLNKSASAADKAAATQTLESTASVEMVFDKQITQAQIDAFIAAGGKIDHVFQMTSFGWTGTIPVGKAEELPKLMGESFLGVVESVEVQLHTDDQGRNGRIRPTVWNLGIDGNNAVEQVTVAILDTGVDSSHTDLAGRSQYWFDTTADALASPADVGHHGTHVAGIAVGSGDASGVSPTSINFTVHGKFPASAGSFFPQPFRVPTSVASMNWTSTMRWDTGGGGTAQIGHGRYSNTGAISLFSASTSGVGTPLSETNNGFANPFSVSSSNMYTPYPSWSVAGAGNRFYAVTNNITYAGVGDTYNAFRGAAPGAKYAGIKVFQNNGSGSSLDIDEGLDKIVTECNAQNIKVANLSLGIVGNPGLSVTTRNKVNTAASNGIVMVISAGNDGKGATSGERVVDDPGRAHYAITVGASNNLNQTTDYSSEGVAGSGIPANGDADTKPDLVAPGGSDSRGYVFSPDSNTLDSTDNGAGSLVDSQANDYLAYKGTSMAAPYVAGAAALVIDALQDGGETWDHNSGANSLTDVLRVKKLLLMTSTETNQTRETGSASGNPTLNRGAKDIQEGYGILNADAAVESHTNAANTGNWVASDAFNTGSFDRRAYARRWNLVAGNNANITLTVPAVGDYDLYLYAQDPDAYGNPVVLASSVNAGLDIDESIVYPVVATQTAYVVVKRVSGGGATNWSLNATTGDLVPPSVSTVAAQTLRTINVTFNEPMGTGVTTAANYVVTGAGKGSLSNSPASVALVSGNTYVLTWNSPQEMLNGSAVTITVSNAQDSAGNTIGVVNSGNTTGIGSIPTITLASAAPNPTNAAIAITVTLSESSTNFEAGDITPTNGTVGSFSGSGTSYSFTLTPTAQGNSSCVVNASTFTDAAGNNNTASNSISRTFDNVAPTITLASVAPDPTNAAIPVTVTLSESSSNFAVGDITPTNGSISAFSGSGTSYSFTLTATAQGTASCIVNASTFTDAASNNNTASNSISRTFDSVAPTITLASVAPNPTNAAIPVTATLSEAGIGFTIGDVTATNGTISAFSGSPTSYSFTLTPTAQGTASCVVNANTFTDAAGNNNTASNSIGRTFDSVAPTVSSINAISGVSASITFNESMGASALTAANYAVSGPGKGTVATNPTSVSQVGNVYTLTWPSGSMVNASSITITATGVQDAAGNGIGAPNSGTTTALPVAVSTFQVE